MFVLEKLQWMAIVNNKINYWLPGYYWWNIAHTTWNLAVIRQYKWLLAKLDILGFYYKLSIFSYKSHWNIKS